jgi:type IIS restriction enzyme
MVENSLGKLALESTGINESLKTNWKYYIESELNESSEKIKIEDVEILDPAMGSGHILVCAFDLLFEIYENLGWSTKDSVLSILKNNLYGLEIDERAGQLASFALMMKAREKFSRLFSVLKREETFKLNTLIIEESNKLSEKIKNKVKDNNLNNLSKIIEKFEDAKEYGSILKLETIDKETLEKEFNLLKESLNNNEQETLIFNEDELNISIEEDLELIESLIAQHIALTNKYEAVVTNPPYMGGKGFSTKLKAYVEKNYKDSKSDLFAVFIERCNEFTKKNCYTSMITMQSWMFLSSFETLRKNLIEKTEIKALNHLGTRAFSEIGGEVVSTVAWVSQKKSPKNDGIYIRLVDYNNADSKEKEFFNKANYFQAKQKDFEKIPGSPIAYWVSDKVREIFGKNKNILFYGDPKFGMSTAKNEKYVRCWFEIEKTKFNNKWFPFNNGGEYKKYYGNNIDLVNWENNGESLKKYERAVLRNQQYYLKKGLTWTSISTNKLSVRSFGEGFLFSSAGFCFFPKNEMDDLFFCGLMNSKITFEIIKILSPTVNFNVGDIGNIAVIFPKDTQLKKYIDNLVQQNISISKEEWDSKETSWDFERLSLIDGKDLKTAYENYYSHWRDNFVQLHRNEEELNKLFIEIYDLQDEMDEKVSFDDITILKKEAKIVEIDNSKAKEFSSESEKYLYDRGVSLEFNKDELVKQFLSYAIGCIMGRYSINKPGLIMANSDDVLELSSNKFLVKDANGDIRQEVKTEFLPDEFGILPITAEKDFPNDIVEMVKEFVKFVYGEESLKDNLNFIAEALGNKDNKNPEEIIRAYFIKDFYADHLQRYQKRPIYWLMNSGKKNAFSCLFYMHRYEPLTVARVRADYLIHYQEMLENKRKFIERQLYAEDITAKEKKNVEKELKDLDVLLKELREYANEVKHIAEQKIVLDLDDGVNVNYEKLGAILKKR